MITDKTKLNVIARNQNELLNMHTSHNSLNFSQVKIWIYSSYVGFWISDLRMTILLSIVIMVLFKIKLILNWYIIMIKRFESCTYFF